MAAPGRRRAGSGLAVMWSRAESMTSMRTCSAPICAASRCASISGSSPNSEMLPRPSLISTTSGIHRRVPEPFGPHHLEPGDQPMGQRGGAAHGQPLEPLLGEVDAGRGLQDHPRAAPREHHQRHLVAADVRVAQQRQHRPLGGLHPLLGVHRRAGVDDEDDQRAGAAAAHLLAQVLALEVQCRRVHDTRGGRLVAPAQLVGRGGAHRGVEGDVGGVLGLHRAHVAAATVGAARLAALAGRLAAAAVAGQADLAHREEVTRVQLRRARRGRLRRRVPGRRARRPRPGRRWCSTPAAPRSPRPVALASDSAADASVSRRISSMRSRAASTGDGALLLSRRRVVAAAVGKRQLGRGRRRRPALTARSSIALDRVAARRRRPAPRPRARRRSSARCG